MTIVKGLLDFTTTVGMLFRIPAPASRAVLTVKEDLSNHCLERGINAEHMSNDSASPTPMLSRVMGNFVSS